MDETDEYRIRADSPAAKRQKYDDVIAMQAVVCITAVLGLAILNLTYPELCGELFGMIKRFSQNSSELFPNPIDLLSSL